MISKNLQRKVNELRNSLEEYIKALKQKIDECKNKELYLSDKDAKDIEELKNFHSIIFHNIKGKYIVSYIDNAEGLLSRIYLDELKLSLESFKKIIEYLK